MNISPLLHIKRLLISFVESSNHLNSYHILLELQRTYDTLDLKPFREFYYRSTYINEAAEFPNYIDSPSGEFEREVYLSLYVGTLNSRAKKLHSLFQTRHTGLLDRVQRQLKGINEIITFISDIERLRIYYRIPNDWLVDVEMYEYLFYIQHDDSTYSCFNIHISRDLATSTSINCNFDRPKCHYETWACKLIWPERFI